MHPLRRRKRWEMRRPIIWTLGALILLGSAGEAKALRARDCPPDRLGWVRAGVRILIDREPESHGGVIIYKGDGLRRLGDPHVLVNRVVAALRILMRALGVRPLEVTGPC